jgi:hypothetical protein
LTPQNWELLQSIFHDASELPQPQRKLYLDDACGNDAALRAEVEALLESASEDETLADAIRGEAALVIRRLGRAVPTDQSHRPGRYGDSLPRHSERPRI